MGRRVRDRVEAEEEISAVPGVDLLADADRPNSWFLLVEGTPQSHVDLSDPGYLDFSYVRRIAHAADLVASEGEPVEAMHLGAGALTVARYVAHSRPGSRQRAVDVDAALVETVRRRLPWDRRAQLRVGIGDAREWITARHESSADLIGSDVFAGARTPARLTSAEFYAEAARVLRPGGRLAYVGVHPCFVGPFAAREGDRVRLHAGYLDRALTFAGPGVGSGIRRRVGVRHRTIADLLNPLTRAGLALERVTETGPDVVPDLLAFAASKLDPGRRRDHADL
jgi:spermidine synthase